MQPREYFTEPFRHPFDDSMRKFRLLRQHTDYLIQPAQLHHATSLADGKTIPASHVLLLHQGRLLV